MPKSLPKIIASILLGIVFLLGGAEIASAQGTTNSAGYYFLFITNPGSTNISIGVSNKYSDFSSCMSDQKVATGTSGAQLAVNCSYYSSDGAAIAKASIMGSAAKKNIEKESGPTELKNFKCGGLAFEIKGCIPIGVFYLIYKPTQYFLMGTAYMFDIMLNLSIRKEFVSDPQFIDKSWKVIRDFSNMAFIFVLLYTGISTMLGAPGWAKTVRNVIIIALLINFSLFFTKVVIDAGNILAVGVYESIKAGNPSISEEISKGFKPQGFLGATNVSDAMDAIIVFLLAAIVSGYAGYIFFKAALLFLGRLIAFWFLMIVSPFAFISIALPKGNVFSQWWGMLLNQAFVAPVFLFLLYLIMQIANAGIFDGSQMTGSWLFDKLLTPILMGTLILMAMQKALALSEKMAGDFGKLGASMAGAVMGVAGGVALGGAAIAGRTVLGGAAQALQKSGRLQNLASSDNYFAKNLGRTGLNLADKGATGSWDVRGADGFIGKNINKGIKAAGVDVGKVPKTSTGGLDAAQKRQKQEDLAFAQKLKVSEEERRKIAAQADPNYTDAKNRVGSEQDALKTAEETARTSASSVAYIQAQEQDIAAKDNLNQVTAVANGSREGLALTALNNTLTDLIAVETKVKDDKTKAEDAYNKAMVSGTITQAITDAFTDSVSAEAAAINARVVGEANRDTAQANFNTAHKATMDAAKNAANTATATLNSTAATYAGSAEKQAAQVAKAQLDATQRIITNAEKAADNVASQRRAAYAQEVEKRGGTRNSQTAADIRGGVEPAAKKSEAEKLLEKLVKASENK